MAKEVKIPQISEGVESATVAEVMVSEGDTIEKEQSIIAVETDKASVEVPSSDAGKVKEIKVKEGDEVKVGDVVLVLEEGEDDSDSESEEGKEESKEEKKKAKAEEEGGDDNEEDEDDEVEEKQDEKKTDKEKKKSSEEKKEKVEKDDGSEEDEQGEEDKSDDGEREEDSDKEDKDDKKEQPKKQKSDSSKSDTAQDDSEVAASPATRRLAREMGVSIEQVKGSGPGGRISEDDVKSHAKGKGISEELSLPDFSQWGKVEREPLSGIRKTTAKNVTASWQNIPHVFQFDEADISGIEDYMEKNKEQVEKAGGKLTVTAVLLKIAATALQQFPKFNASIDVENDEMILKKYINIGIAVATESGLLVPVVRDVNRKSIVELSVEITELAEKAREKKLTAEEMQGGNFTISNLGGIGGTNFTPIIYHPQVAILGVSRTSTKPVYVDGKFEPKQILPLSLSYDHRLIDGAEGAEFLRWIGQALEDPYKALLGA